MPLGDFTSVPAGADANFLAAMRQDQIQAGMTTEPTITRPLKIDEAKFLVDMHRVENVENRNRS